MEPRTPERRSLPPGRARAPLRPPRRAGALGAIALVAGLVVATRPPADAAAAPDVAVLSGGTLDLRVAAVLADGDREGELHVRLAWRAPGAPTAAAVERARDAATGWLATRRAVELVERGSREALREVVRRALFPDGAGDVDALRFVSLRVR